MYRAELLKLRTTRTPWIIAAVAAVGMVIVQSMTISLPRAMGTLESLAGSASEMEDIAPELAALADLGSVDVQRGMLDVLGSSSGSSGLTALCMLLLGVLAVTTDFRTGGIVPTALVAPDRWRILAGKAVATAVVALLAGAVLALLTAAGLVLAIVSTPGVGLALGAGEILAGWGRGLAVMVLLAWVGLAVGTLVRGQVAAIVLVASLALVEPMIQGLALLVSGGSSTVTAWLPLTLGSLASSGQGVGLPGGSATLGALVALVGLAVWAAVGLGAATVVFRRRDLA